MLLHCGFCQSCHGFFYCSKSIPKCFKEYSRLILLIQYQKTSVSATNGSCNRVSLLQSSCCFPVRKTFGLPLVTKTSLVVSLLICLCQPFTDPILFPPFAFHVHKITKQFYCDALFPWSLFPIGVNYQNEINSQLNR